jgi:hypothetical protein
VSAGNPEKELEIVDTSETLTGRKADARQARAGGRYSTRTQVPPKRALTAKTIRARLRSYARSKPEVAHPKSVRNDVGCLHRVEIEADDERVNSPVPRCA